MKPRARKRVSETTPSKVAFGVLLALTQSFNCHMSDLGVYYISPPTRMSRYEYKLYRQIKAEQRAGRLRRAKEEQQKSNKNKKACTRYRRKKARLVAKALR